MASINACFDRQPQDSTNDRINNSTDTPVPNSPLPSPGFNRRTLLLVYVHGFMGSNVSFQNFPQHLQTILSIKLRDFRDVQTKIYPTFKTRDKIDVAVEGISRWLSRFENDHTDFILVGHSMGGLVTAELALKQHRDYANIPQHRILGLLCIDVPFYGLHPGIIPSGLASIFKPPPSPPIAQPLLTPTSRPFLKKALSFIKKYSDDLPKAAGRLITSHLEFGGALGDWKGLYTRWKRIVELEYGTAWGGAMGRTHVVNYYTVSLGERPVEREDGLLTPPPPTGSIVEGIEDEDIDLKTAVSEVKSAQLDSTKTLSLSEEPTGESSERVEYFEERSSNNPSLVVSSPPPTTSFPRPVPPIPQFPPTPSTSSTYAHSRPVPSIPQCTSTSESLEPTTFHSTEHSQAETNSASNEKEKKPKSPRKFCLLPPRSSERDRIWVPHYIYSHSEVTAHCAVFLVDADDGGARYQGLLDDVADRIEGWISEQIAD